MTSRFTHRNLPGLLLQARESLMAQRRPHLREQGLSDQQWRVLRVLDAHNGDGLETGRIAREAQLLGPSLSGVLARMERDGLVVRQRDPADARRSVVLPTPQGRALVQALSAPIEAHYGHLETHLGQDKLAQLYDLLDELIALHPDASAVEENE